MNCEVELRLFFWFHEFMNDLGVIGLF